MMWIGTCAWSHVETSDVAATRDTLSVSYAGHGATYQLRQCTRERLAKGLGIDLATIHTQIERRSKSPGCEKALVDIMDAIALAEFKIKYTEGVENAKA